jgi:hypothetical protein
VNYHLLLASRTEALLVSDTLVPGSETMAGLRLERSAVSLLRVFLLMVTEIHNKDPFYYVEPVYVYILVILHTLSPLSVCPS